MRVAVLGTGAFGTALSINLSKSVESVTLWGRNKLLTKLLHTSRENSSYLPGHLIPESVTVSNDIKSTLTGISTLLLCVPTQELRNLCTLVRDTGILNVNVPLLICCKGIENKTLKLPSEIAEELLPNNDIFVLSGPALATEIARGLPCTMVLAGKDMPLAKLLASQLGNDTMHMVPSLDLVSVQISAALKNVVAIACGIVLGKNLGHNAVSTVIVRGMSEIRDLCIAKAGHVDIETLLGFAGLGDLVLTCTTPSSRNMSLGLEIGKGNKQISVEKQNNTLVEGALSAQSVLSLGNSLNLSMPVCTAVANLCSGNLSADEAVSKILHSEL